MLGRAYEGQDCSIARALEVVGERWTLLILRDLLFDVSRFDDLAASVGASASILTNRLKRLEEEGLVTREMYQTNPPRYDYRLTTKARALQPVLFYLAKWGDSFYPSDLGPPRRALHRGCGGDVDERLTCTQCGQNVWFDAIDTIPRSELAPAASASVGKWSAIAQPARRRERGSTTVAG